MKIESVRIENFRSFKDETILFNDHTCLLGPNCAGKPTVLAALNVFFREAEGSQTDISQLQKEDFHGKNTDAPIKITVAFFQLSENAQADFSNYFRQGQLVASTEASFDAVAGNAPARHTVYGLA